MPEYNQTRNGVDVVTSLHEARMDSVVDVLCEHRVCSVLDLGCGDGALLARLVAMEQLDSITGIDVCKTSLDQARKRLSQINPAPRLTVNIFEGSFTSYDVRLEGFDAAVLLETIEHIEPDHLSTVENALFLTLRPNIVIMTTPNSDYNALLGVPPGRLRHPDHRFEWGTKKFEKWCDGIAQRHGYTASFRAIGGCHPQFGGPTQMAIFKKRQT